MEVFRYPKRSEWSTIVSRPPVDTTRMEASVRDVIARVRSGGDATLREFTQRFDGVDIADLQVTAEEIAAAERRVPNDLKAAIATAAANIEIFHAAQLGDTEPIDTMPGVVCWRRSVAIERVGIYVPAGSAPLFSTVLMLGIPARLAGCRDIVLCSPPARNGLIDDVVLYAASLCGIDSIFKVGGAQAIAAMAYGTETIPQVYKIFGPGNGYVTCAKQIVAADVAIDMPAGPSEVAVLADESSNPRFVAADLLSQAEHGPDSQVILVTTSESVIEATMAEIERQLTSLPRSETAKASLANSKAVLVATLAEGLDILNQYAAEHLILAVNNAATAAEGVINAGSVFIGNYSCESAGDYASGTNHTLPTGGFARSFSGVSVDSFVKKITFQRLSAEGIRGLGPAVELMAAAEGLDAHRRAISIRLEELDNGV